MQADIFRSMFEGLSDVCPDAYAAEYALDYRVERVEGGIWIYVKFKDGSETDILVED